MMGRPTKFVVPFRTMFTALAALAVLLGMVEASRPQSAAPPAPGVQEATPQAAPQQGAQAPAPPAGEENPGLINEMGKLFGKILPPIKSPSETIDDLNARAKDAGEALSRLAKPAMMVSGRVICPASVNGAPDCKAGADNLCQSKGYKEGKSLTADSAETCSPKVLIPGRQRKPDDCRTDTYVTRALCQ
ncbi:MAG: hypothetical protein HY852_06515 [Bradyrhizobium sp.]|nr:hypothetical protein [Bradyrhizobium sp.]